MTDCAFLRPVAFEDRYETHRQLWLDGSHGGWLAFDSVIGREIVLNIPYRSSDNERFIEMAKIAGIRSARVGASLDIGTVDAVTAHRGGECVTCVGHVAVVAEATA